MAVLQTHELKHYSITIEQLERVLGTDLKKSLSQTSSQELSFLDSVALLRSTLFVCMFHLQTRALKTGGEDK